jgi:hypothetical protein
MTLEQLKEKAEQLSEKDYSGKKRILHEDDFNSLIDSTHQATVEEIIKIAEGMKVCTDAGRADPSFYHCENTRDGTIDELIKAIKK